MTMLKELTYPQIDKALSGVTSFVRLLQFHDKQTTRTDSSTKIRGVRETVDGKFAARIMINQHSFHLGIYPKKREAILSIQNSRKRLVRVLTQRARQAGEI